MKTILKLALLLLFAAPVFAQYQPVQGWCEDGGQNVILQGLQSLTTVQQSFPACTVTVYLTGTTNLATIYSNATGTPLSNPFTAQTNGQLTFYALPGQGLDVVTSGGTTPNLFPSPVTLFVDTFPGGGQTPIAALSCLNVQYYPYFAKGDGVADDTAAIQQAINDSNGKCVYIPTPTGSGKRYKITVPLYYLTPASGYATAPTIIGDSMISTLIDPEFPQAWAGSGASASCTTASNSGFTCTLSNGGTLYTPIVDAIISGYTCTDASAPYYGVTVTPTAGSPYGPITAITPGAGQPTHCTGSGTMTFRSHNAAFIFMSTNSNFQGANGLHIRNIAIAPTTTNYYSDGIGFSGTWFGQIRNVYITRMYNPIIQPLQISPSTFTTDQGQSFSMEISNSLFLFNSGVGVLSEDALGAGAWNVFGNYIGANAFGGIVYAGHGGKIYQNSVFANGCNVTGSLAGTTPQNEDCTVVDANGATVFDSNVQNGYVGFGGGVYIGGYIGGYYLGKYGGSPNNIVVQGNDDLDHNFRWNSWNATGQQVQMGPNRNNSSTNTWQETGNILRPTVQELIGGTPLGNASSSSASEFIPPGDYHKATGATANNLADIQYYAFADNGNSATLSNITNPIFDSETNTNSTHYATGVGAIAFLTCAGGVGSSITTIDPGFFYTSTIATAMNTAANITIDSSHYSVQPTFTASATATGGLSLAINVAGSCTNGTWRIYIPSPLYLQTRAASEKNIVIDGNQILYGGNLNAPQFNFLSGDPAGTPLTPTFDMSIRRRSAHQLMFGALDGSTSGIINFIQNYTDDSNYGAMQWNSVVGSLQSVAVGTGTPFDLLVGGGAGQQLILRANNGSKWILDINGNFKPTSVTQTIGATAAPVQDVVALALQSGTTTNNDITGRVSLSGGTGSYTLKGTYASAGNYICADVTTPANTCTASETSTVITFTGTGSDIIKYIGVGRN